MKSVVPRRSLRSIIESFGRKLFNSTDTIFRRINSAYSLFSMKFVSLVLFLSVVLVFGERQVEDANQGLLQFDSAEEQEMHTKCGSLVAEHKGLYNDFSTFTSTGDTSTEPFLLTARTNLRHREVTDMKTTHEKFDNLDLPFSLPLSLAPHFGMICEWFSCNSILYSLALYNDRILACRWT